MELIYEKTEAVYAELNKRAKAAVILQEAIYISARMSDQGV